MTSSEIERARQFLERHGAVNSQTDASARNEEHSVSSTSDTPVASLAIPTGRCESSGPLLVTVEEPGQSGSSPRRGPDTCSRIVWQSVSHSDGTLDASGGAVEVPRAVAKRFGPQERLFGSYHDFSAYLETLSATVAAERIEALIKSRERCSHEMAERLRREGFAPTQVQAAVERAMRCGLIDDARYAECYVRAKIRAGWGRSRIERELALQRVDPTVLLEGYPEAFFSIDSERQRAFDALRTKHVPEKNPVEKLARFLIGRGFGTGMALSVAREYVSAHAPCRDEGCCDEDR